MCVYTLPKMTEPPRQKGSLQWQLTSGGASPFDLGIVQHSHVRPCNFPPAEGTMEGSQDGLAELLLSTFAKRSVSLNPIACSYDSQNISKSKHHHCAAVVGRCFKERRGEVREKLPEAASTLGGCRTAISTFSSHSGIATPILKKKDIWVSAIKNNNLLSMYVNCFNRGKDVQVQWLIFAFISKSVRLILKAQKSFLHIWFILCSVSRVYETLS